MKVKCLRITDRNTDQLVDSRAGLWIGDIYQVLSIFVGTSGLVEYQVLGPRTQDSPGIHHASQFEIVDTRLPRNWIPYHNAERGYFELSPAPWTPLGFWEAYFDDEPWALEIFAQEKAIIDELEETQD